MASNLKIEMPKYIGENITFKLENSPNRHGEIIDFLTLSQDNFIEVIGYKVKCKNSSVRTVYLDEVIES